MSPIFFSNEVDQYNLDDTNLLSLDNRVFQVGEVFDVKMSYPTNSEGGLQFKLAWNNELLELIQPASSCNDAHIFSTESYAVSWNALMDGMPANLVDLKFRAKKPGQLSDAIWLDESSIKAESYNLAGETYALDLRFDTYSAQAILYQNYPNPAINGTRIPFYLPKDSPIRLSILDASGRMIWEESGIFTEGYHEIEVPALDVSGLFYYRLETSENTATKKLFL